MHDPRRELAVVANGEPVSPAPRVADAGGGVPRDGRNLVVALLNPEGVVVVEMDHGAERFAVVEAVFDVRVSGKAAEPGLNPGIARDQLRVGDGEVFHDAERLSVGAEAGVEEAVGAGVLVGVGEGELVADGISLEKAEGVADADVEVGTREEAGAVEVGAGHEEEVGGGSGIGGLCGGWLGRGGRRLGG